MANLDKDEVVAAFTEAYKKVNGKAPSIESKSGWYSVDGGKNVRLAQLQEMTASLASGSSDGTSESEEKKSAKERGKSRSETSEEKGTFIQKVRIFGKGFLGRKAQCRGAWRNPSSIILHNLI